MKTLEVLLEHGASVNSACSTGTPLVWALGAQKRECASFLLDKGASPNGRGNNGVSACLLAAATGASYRFITNALSVLLAVWVL